MNHEKRAVDEMHTRHLKLLAAKIMGEALHGVHRDNLTGLLNELKERLKKTKERRGAVKRFRRVLWLNRRNRLLKYFEIWHKFMAPLKERKVQRKLPTLINRDGKLRRHFIEWYHLAEKLKGKRLRSHAIMTSFCKAAS